MAAYTGFTYDPEEYYPEAVRQRQHSISDYRKEYQRLYRVAQKRLRNFEKSGRTDAAAYRYNVDRLKPSTMLSDEQLGRALYDVQRMLTSKRGSVSDLKRWEGEQVSHFRELGLDFINRGNLRTFGEFMEEARQQGLDKIYGSEQVVRLFGEAVNKKIDVDDIKQQFEYYVQNVVELAALPRHRSAEARTADAYRAEIEQGKKRGIRRGKRR